MPDDFADFGDIKIPYRRSLPDSLLFMGEYGNEMRAFLVDGDRRIVLGSVSQPHYGRLPVVVPTGAAGKLEEHPTSGVRNVFEINVINVTAGAVTLKLYLHDDVPSSTKIIAANNYSIAARGLFQWQGVVTLETKDIWGLASAANSLYAFFSVRDEVSSFRV